MKQQTRPPKLEKEEDFIYKQSQWIQVTGKEKGSKNHFVEAQGERVMEMLDEAFCRHKKDKPDIYIISPFKSAADGMRDFLMKNWDAAEEKKNYICSMEDKRIGTVHTFQGKEADEVIFLLGCDEGAQGAIKWVPDNIVNVAVTRAKYRLYAVGDADVWRSSDCVKLMMDKLPKETWHRRRNL